MPRAVELNVLDFVCKPLNVYVGDPVRVTPVGNVVMLGVGV